MFSPCKKILFNIESWVLFCRLQQKKKQWPQSQLGCRMWFNMLSSQVQTQCTSSQCISTANILEGSTVMDNVRDFPRAVCLLFGFMYALHLNYPKCMENTLNFNSLSLNGKQNPSSKTAYFAEQTNGVSQLTMLSTNFEGFLK